MNASTLRKTGPALLMGFSSLLSAQSPVDIGLHTNNGQLEVHMRPSADFDGILSSYPLYGCRLYSKSGLARYTFYAAGAK